MIKIEEICDPEQAEWYVSAPRERWRETVRLWNVFSSLGGSLDPEPDTQSPFHDVFTASKVPAHGRPGLRVIRRR
jgi:hypothetical protein